jgi:hypothetical protein
MQEIMAKRMQGAVNIPFLPARMAVRAYQFGTTIQTLAADWTAAFACIWLNGTGDNCACHDICCSYEITGHSANLSSQSRFAKRKGPDAPSLDLLKTSVAKNDYRS